MIEFAMSDLESSEEIKALLFLILSKNKTLAELLFKGVVQSRPAVCAAWQDAFVQEYGKAALGLELN